MLWMEFRIRCDSLGMDWTGEACRLEMWFEDDTRLTSVNIYLALLDAFLGGLDGMSSSAAFTELSLFCFAHPYGSFCLTVFAPPLWTALFRR